MLERILTQLLYLLIIFPICYFSFKNKSKETWRVFLIFCGYFITIQITVFIPIRYSEFNCLGGNFNWTGKTLSLFASILFLIFYRKFSLKDYHITLKQTKNSLQSSFIFIALLILMSLLLGYFKSEAIPFNFERFSYQLTLPGIDEELAYRGIMLGLLLQIFKSKIFKINIAVLVTALLFGLMHSLFINNDFTLSFNSYIFSITFIAGLAFGYISLKTGSILTPILIHNLYNIILQIFKMFIL